MAASGESPTFKTCGQCGFRNSVQKNYCDQCGNPFAPGHDLPAAGRYAPLMGITPPPIKPSTAARTTQRKPASQRWMAAAYRIRSIGSLIFLICLAFGLFTLGLDYWKTVNPQKAVPRQAASYLTALSQGDYANAYYSLSSVARARCSLEEFRLHQSAVNWTWNGLNLIKKEPDLMMVEYYIAHPGKEPEKNYLTFVLEDGHWALPFNEHILKNVKKLFKQKNIDMALIRAQEALTVNPRDPVARAYFCQASHWHKLPAQAGRECALALKLHQDYPSQISPAALKHVRAIANQSR
ncbi:MAG: hypothetical protein A3J74_10025 [Elusimicrobia bacterium RIFCSPHIGHO2_02_FULL_57_9]|nr:MAG: hypothetical protein A3J74_10025 [Elusimicrobia bacterium RIFCSPHIGHO2_02_FULL_57_9]